MEVRPRAANAGQRPREPAEQNSVWDKAAYAAFLAASMLIVLLGGAVLTTANVFPGPQVARAYQGGKALYNKLTQYQNVYASDLWNMARSPERGVTVHEASRARAGVTLLRRGTTPRLI